MRKLLIVITFLTALCGCSAQSYLEESKDLAAIPFTAAYDESENGIALLWSSEWDIASFEILRGLDEKTLTAYVSNVAQKQWLDDDTDPGTDYFYSLRAFNGRGRQIAYGHTVKGRRAYQDYATMEAPTDFKADDKRFGDRVHLYWYGQAQSRFRIYRSVNPLDGYQKIAEVGGIRFADSNGLKFADTNVSQSSTYYYRISSVGKDKTDGLIKERFFNNTDKNGSPSLESSAHVLGSTTDAPSDTVASGIVSPLARKGSIQITWAWDEASEYYRIYRSDSADGNYQLIAPYVKSRSGAKGLYTDKGMPSLEGRMEGGVYVYPTYYYRVSAVKNNQESGLSVSAPGSALNPADILPAPENFTVRLKTAPADGFAREMPVYSSGYQLLISWDKLPADSAPHRFILVQSNTVTGASSPVGFPLSSDTSSYEIPSPLFGSSVRYMVYAVNTDRGGLPGDEMSALYNSYTPNPPLLASASKNMRLDVTNFTDISPEAAKVTTIADGTYPYVTHSYFKTGWSSYAVKNAGFVTRLWRTEAKVGFIELKWTPDASSETESYKIYRRLKGSGAAWELVTNVAQSNDIDNPDILVGQSAQDESFTADQYRGSGSPYAYPVFEYRITAVNAGFESALAADIREGSAVDPKDILPAPSYLTVPFHYAHALGIANFSSWTVIDQGGDKTTGFSRIVGTGASAGAKQRIYVVWDSIDAKGASYDFRVRHARGSDIAGASWYTHGSREDSNWIRLNNEITTDSMTGLYVVLDSMSYSPESAIFDVAATNQSAGGLLGNSIGIVFQEPGTSPY